MATAAPAAASDTNVGDLEAQIRAVAATITNLENDIEAVKKELKDEGIPMSKFGTNAVYTGLMDHLKALMRKEEQLLDDKKLLREEKAKLLDRQQTVGELLVTV